MTICGGLLKRQFFIIAVTVACTITCTRLFAQSFLPPVYSILLFDDDNRFVAAITGELNDTGSIFGGNDATGIEATCTSDIPAPQDCDQGRDATENDNSDGFAGFSFLKLSSLGEILAADATEWSCVGDHVTGLMWEVKSESGLSNSADKYSWYNTNASSNGGVIGDENVDGDVCFGYSAGVSSTYCNTEAYVARINTQGLCGHNDWRLPNLEELRGLADLSTSSSTTSIDTDYFPNTVPLQYWTSSPYFYDTSRARIIVFDVGGDNHAPRNIDYYVRLVRSNP